MASPIRGSARESRGKPGLAKHLQQGVFPGRISPGLIEARGTGRDRPTGGSDFPGESARASLKNLDIRGVPAKVGIPQAISRGLIEGWSGRASGAARSIFPGRISRGLIEGPA